MKSNNKICTHPHFTIRERVLYYLGDISILDLSNFAHEYIPTILIDEGITFNKMILDTTTDLCNEHILVVEPHLDDFALSASGYVINEINHGATCHVLNIFSRTNEDYFTWKDKKFISREIYESIRLEEAKFAIHLLLSSEFSSLHKTSLNLNSTFDSADIVNKILSITKNESITQILFPIGIFHKDHLAIYSVAKKLCTLLNNRIKIVFYEDYPYSNNKIAYSAAVQRFKGDFDVKEVYVAVNDFFEEMVDLMIAYRSQFNDLNRKQMQAIMREYFKNISSEMGCILETNNDYLLQRYFTVNR